MTARPTKIEALKNQIQEQLRAGAISPAILASGFAALAGAALRMSTKVKLEATGEIVDMPLLDLQRAQQQGDHIIETRDNPDHQFLLARRPAAPRPWRGPMMVSDLIEALQDVANPTSTPVYFEPAGNEDARIAIRSAYVSSRDTEPPNNPDGSPNYECGEFIFAVSDDET